MTMIASVVLVIRNERPVRYDSGPKAARASSTAARRSRSLSGAGCCSESRTNSRACRVSGFQNPLSSSACGEAAISSSFVARVRAPAVGRQLREAAVGVEDRGQREHARDLGPAPCPARSSPRSIRADLRQQRRVDGRAGRHDQLDEADPSEPRLDLVVVADDAALRAGTG